jgi:hypothetical protein
METSTIQNAARQFGKGEITVENLGSGLIHHTYKVDYSESPSVVLQCINQNTFHHPENIVHNYELVYNYLSQHSDQFIIPKLIITNSGNYSYSDEEENFWRATQFIPASFAPTIPGNEKEVFSAARCFASFTKSLSGLDINQLAPILPGFHNLAERYEQFETAIKKGPIFRLLRATHVISELRQKQSLVAFYQKLSDEVKFPTRVMHHDCKISNVLFEKSSGKAICAVDLDTVMPGKYFSDLGDMIRTMACTVSEDSTAWEVIDINKKFYDAILEGYTEGIGDEFTAEEKRNIHKSGLMMAYMQCMRFVTDFINNDVYYKTTYDEQNLNRALNQLILVEKIEDFLKEQGYDNDPLN